MTEFTEALAKWSAKEIAAAIGCSERAAYAWKRAARAPEKWAQRLILAELNRKGRKARKD